MGALIYAVLFYFIPSLVDFDFLSGGRTLDQALQAGSRPYIWKSALDYATQSPILGIGLGTTRYGYYIVAHPHNSVLQWAAELGLLSVGIILATISLSIFRWIKAVRHSNMAPNAESDFSHAALLAAIIGMLGYSLVSGVIVMPLSQTILVLISGWMLSAVWDRKTTDISLTFSNKGNIVFGMSILLIAGFIVTLLPDFELLLHSSYEQQFYGPKFWGQSTIP